MQEEDIVKELVKYDVTETALEEIRETCMPMVVTSPDDLEGYETCKALHIEVKKIKSKVEGKRKELKEDSLAFGKRLDDEAKRIQGKLEPILVHLSVQRKIVEDEQARIQAEEDKKIQDAADKIQKDREDALEKQRKEQEEKEADLKAREDKIEADRVAMDKEKADIEADKERQKREKEKAEQLAKEKRESEERAEREKEERKKNEENRKAAREERLKELQDIIKVGLYFEGSIKETVIVSSTEVEELAIILQGKYDL